MARRYSPWHSKGMTVNNMLRPSFKEFDTPLTRIRAVSSTPQKFEKDSDREKIDVFRALPRFLRNLWTMLNDRTIDDSIEWIGANTFWIKDTEKFVKEVIPKYFKHNRLSSFVRQLNLYQFVKVRERPNKASYRWTHAHLIRGNMRALLKIKRKIPDNEKKGQVIYKGLMIMMAEQQGTISKLTSRMKELESEIIEGRELHRTVKKQLDDTKALLEDLFPKSSHIPGGNSPKKPLGQNPKNTSTKQEFASEDWIPKSTKTEKPCLFVPAWLKSPVRKEEKIINDAVEELDPFAV